MIFFPVGVKNEPCRAKNDRLHCVETDEAVLLFENVKNDTTDEWNAGESSGYVGH